MAAITGTAIAAAATVGSAALQNNAAKKASSAASRAASEANALQAQQYQQARSDLMPYQQAGVGALEGLNRLAGGDYSAFQNSPDYQFSLQQGLQGLDRSAAARGSLYSGGQQADLVNYSQGLASQQLGNYRNSLFSLANMGASSGSALAGIGQNYAGAYGQNLNNSAAAQGANALTQGNNWTQALAGLGGLASNYLQQNAGTRQSSYNPGANTNFGNNVNSLMNFKGTW